MMSLIKKLLLFISGLALCQAAYGQRLAIKTDALKWSLYTPNLGVEFSATEHTSFVADVSYGFLMYGLKDAEFWDIQPEWRYWFNGRPMIRQYLGIGALISQYDLTTSKKNISGDAIGMGVTFGHAWYLSSRKKDRDKASPKASRWRVEAYGGFGVVAFSNKEKYVTDHSDDIYILSGNHHNNYGFYFLPTKLGFSLSYILF